MRLQPHTARHEHHQGIPADRSAVPSHVQFELYHLSDISEEEGSERVLEDFKKDQAAKYMKDGDIIAYDIMVDKKKLEKVLKRLEEFDC